MSQAINIVAGERREGGSAIEIRNPSDLNQLVGTYGCASRADVEDGFAAAREAAASWRRTTPEQRANLLHAVSAAIFKRKDEIAQVMCAEGGKTVPDALGEIVRAGNIGRFFAGEALRLAGEKLASVRPDVEVHVDREPVGAVGLITPWNFPIAIPLWKLGPALAFGNTAVWKPSEKTPGTSALIADIFVEAGVPAGVFNMVMGPGADLGAAVVDQADAVSFTGSSATGRKIAVRCAERLIRVQLEMGGKNPLIVLDDADLEQAVDVALNGAFFQAGQRCTASSRLIVTEAIHDRFAARLAEKVKALRLGHAAQADTQIGPVIDKVQFDKVMSYVDHARSEGIELLAGGGKPELETPGWYVPPTLFGGTDNTQKINREEIFGPVAAILKVKDYEEALAVANDTEYGLSAGICTTSAKHARHFQAHAAAGMTMLNLPTAGVDYHTPFGGRKASSYGPREQGAYAVEFYTAVKTSYLAV